MRYLHFQFLRATVRYSVYYVYMPLMLLAIAAVKVAFFIHYFKFIYKIFWSIIPFAIEVKGTNFVLKRLAERKRERCIHGIELLSLFFFCFLLLFFWKSNDSIFFSAICALEPTLISSICTWNCQLNWSFHINTLKAYNRRCYFILFSQMKPCVHRNTYWWTQSILFEPFV